MCRHEYPVIHAAHHGDLRMGYHPSKPGVLARRRKGSA